MAVFCDLIVVMMLDS